jgi:hypothetical protein
MQIITTYQVMIHSQSYCVILIFIHIYRHDILIFVLNYDKKSLNNNVPYVIDLSLNAFS